MSGVVTSRVDPPDHLLRLVGICPWDGGWLGAFAAFGRDMSLGWRVAGCVGRVWPGYVRERRSQASRAQSSRPSRVAGCVCRVWSGYVPGMAMSWACCSACFLLDPVAGEAEAARDATCRTRVSPRLASAWGRFMAMNGQAPWLIGSSWTHMISAPG